MCACCTHMYVKHIVSVRVELSIETSPKTFKDKNKCIQILRKSWMSHKQLFFVEDGLVKRNVTAIQWWLRVVAKQCR